MPTVLSYAAIGLTLATVRKGRFLSSRGVDIMQAEILLIRLSAPVLAIVAAGLWGRRRGHG